MTEENLEFAYINGKNVLRVYNKPVHELKKFQFYNEPIFCQIRSENKRSEIDSSNNFKKLLQNDGIHADISEDALQKLFGLFTCNKCKNPIKDPVCLPDCRHEFCRNCIFKEGQPSVEFCPACKAKINWDNFRADDSDILKIKNFIKTNSSEETKYRIIGKFDYGFFPNLHVPKIIEVNKNEDAYIPKLINQQRKKLTEKVFLSFDDLTEDDLIKKELDINKTYFAVIPVAILNCPYKYLKKEPDEDEDYHVLDENQNVLEINGVFINPNYSADLERDCFIVPSEFTLESLKAYLCYAKNKDNLDLIFFYGKNNSVSILIK